MSFARAFFRDLFTRFHAASPLRHKHGTSRVAAPIGQRSWYRYGVTLKARVHQSRFVVEEPTDLPEGTEVDLRPLDPGDWLDQEDRVALHLALLASQEDLEAGRLIDAEEVLRELRTP